MKKSEEQVTILQADHFDSLPKETQSLISELTNEVNNCNDNDTLMDVSAKCADLPKHLQAGLRKSIVIKATELGLKFNKEQNKFIENVG